MKQSIPIDYTVTSDGENTVSRDIFYNYIVQIHLQKIRQNIEKLYLNKIFFYFTLPLILIVIFIGFITIISKRYQLDRNVRDLYVGDSHVEYAIIDSLLLNGENLSSGAESY
jgi:hypothetical protein